MPQWTDWDEHADILRRCRETLERLGCTITATDGDYVATGFEIKLYADTTRGELIEIVIENKKVINIKAPAVLRRQLSVLYGKRRVRYIEPSIDQEAFESSKISHIRSDPNDQVINLKLRDGSRLEAWETETGVIVVQRITIADPREGSRKVLFKEFNKTLDSRGLIAHLDPSIMRGSVPQKVAKYLKKYGFVESPDGNFLVRHPDSAGGDNP